MGYFFTHYSGNRTKMLAVAVALCGSLALAACSSSGGGSSTTGNSTGGQSGAPTATTKPAHKPTWPLTINQAFCDGLMSVTEAGQIMNAAVKTDRVISTGEGGSCNYETAPYKAAVFVAFLPGAVGLQAIANSITSEPGFAGSVTPVSGIGDQAFEIVNPLPNTSIIQYRLMVADGGVIFDVVVPNSSAGSAAVFAKLTQVAQLEIGRL